MLYDDINPPKPRRGRRLLAAFLLVDLLALGGAAYWAVGTPYYSLYRLQQAIEDHDLAAFEARFDTASVVGQLVDEMLAEVQLQAQRQSAPARPSGNLWEAAGRQMALGLTNLVVEGFKPQIKAVATQAVNERLKQTILGLPAPGASLEGGAAGSDAGGPGGSAGGSGGAGGPAGESGGPGGAPGQPGGAGEPPTVQGLGGGVPGAVGQAPKFHLQSLSTEGKKAIAKVVREDTQQSLGLVLIQQADRSWRVVGLDVETLRALRPQLPRP